MKKHETNKFLGQLLGCSPATIRNWRSRREQGAGAQLGTAVAESLDDDGRPFEILGPDGSGIQIRVTRVSPASPGTAPADTATGD